MSLPRRLLDTTALAWMDTPGLDASTISAPTSAMMMGLRPAPRALGTPRATVTTVGPERGVLSISAPRYVRFLLLEIVSIDCFPPWENLISIYVPSLSHTSSVTIRAPPPVPRVLVTLLVIAPTTTEASTARLISVLAVMTMVPQAAPEGPTSGTATVR